MRLMLPRVHVSHVWQLKHARSAAFLYSFMLFLVCFSLVIHPSISYSIDGPANSPATGGTVITVTGPIVQPISFAVGLTSCQSLVIVSVDAVACKVAPGTGSGLNVKAHSYTFISHFSYDAPLVSKCSSLSSAGGLLHLTGSNFGTSELTGNRTMTTKVLGKAAPSRWLSDSSLEMVAPAGAGRTMDFTVVLLFPQQTSFHPPFM